MSRVGASTGAPAVSPSSAGSHGPLPKLPLAHRMRWVWWGLGLFVANFLATLGHGSLSNDEMWFLQVVRRVVAGEVLYRDVFYGATPLAVYLAAPFVALSGAEVAVVKGLVALSATLTLLVVRRILQQLDLGQRFPLIAAVVVVFAPSWMIGTGALYVPLAYLLLALTLMWGLEGNSGLKPSPAGWPNRQALLSGVAAGLCFGAHQTVGALALLALIGSSALAWRPPGLSMRQRMRGPVMQLIAFSVSAGAVLIPVLISGGAAKFVEYAFTAKRLYVETAQISYVWGLRLLGRLAGSLAAPGNARAFYWQLEFVIPILALIAIVAALLVRRASRQGPLWIVTFFGVAAYLGGLPRMGIEHLSVTLPILAVALVYALACLPVQIGLRPARLLRGLLVLALVPGFAWLYLPPLLGLATGTQQIAAGPHLRGVVLPVQAIEFLGRSSHALR